MPARGMYGRRCYYKATIAPQIYARRQTNLVADDAARVEKIDVVGSKNSNPLSDPDFTTEMLADQLAARPV